MSRITKEFIKALRQEINDALAPVAARHNLTLTAGNASFFPDKGTASYKLNLVTQSEDGSARDLPAELFVSHASMIGLRADDLHKEITIGGSKFKIAGYKPKARKNCIVIKDVHSGKTYVTDVNTVKYQLAGK